ncbi:MAG: hypothetical protein IJJ41_01520 [Clostridia bacterium]|nr:hypothetical protein [Clostridia bacterium]
MGKDIAIKLLKGENIILRELDKKSCFFVGKPGESTYAEFEKAYEITNEEWPKNVEASFKVGTREFDNLSFSKGKSLSKAKGKYDIKRHPDGTRYLCLSLEYPVRDSYDKMYNNHFRRAVYCENGEVVVIQAKYGMVMPKINVYVGLEESVPFLDRILEELGSSNEEQVKYLTLLARCVAQKFGLSDEAAEQMENHIIYNCLDAASISATYSPVKARGRVHAFYVLKSIADNICGACMPDWYRTAPRRRYEKLNDVIDYMRRLKRGKTVEWGEEEMAFCREIYKWFDHEVFSEIYAVSMVLLKFLAENDVRDVHSLKKLAGSPGIFSPTLMADTVDSLSAKRLDGEAKTVFFSLLGNDVQQAKERAENALYRYHAASNRLLRNALALPVPVDAKENDVDEKAWGSAIERAALYAAAKATLAVKRQLNKPEHRANNDEILPMHDMFVNTCAKYGYRFPSDEREDLTFRDIMDIARQYMSGEKLKLHGNPNVTTSEIYHEMVPEYTFVRAYVVAYVLVTFLQQPFEDQETFEKRVKQFAARDEALLHKALLQPVILEAKCRFAAMSSEGLLEVMAQIGEA